MIMITIMIVIMIVIVIVITIVIVMMIMMITFSTNQQNLHVYLVFLECVLGVSSINREPSLNPLQQQIFDYLSFR